MTGMLAVVCADDFGTPSPLGHSSCMQKYLALLETYFRGAVPGTIDDGL